MFDAVVSDVLRRHPQGLRVDAITRFVRLAEPKVRVDEVAASLLRLQALGLVRLGPGRRWRLASPAFKKAKDFSASQNGGSCSSEPPVRLLAVRAHTFPQALTQDTSSSEFESDNELNLGWDFFRAYAKHCANFLAEEERGKVDCFLDNALERVTLLQPEGRWWPEESEIVEISIPLNQLTEEFGSALAKRLPADIALGWPIQVLDTKSGQNLRPVVTLPANYSVREDHLVLTVESQSPDVALDWFSGRSFEQRRQMETLLGLTEEEHEDGERRTSFDLQTLCVRLQLFLGASLREALDLEQLSPGLSLPAPKGFYNVLGIFLLDPMRYGKGAIRELKELASWEDAALEKTALAPIFQSASSKPSDVELSESVLTVTEPLPLGENQLNAVRDAAHRTLTVITGPPGTGKSQAAVAILTNAALHGQSALLASHNHRALDAVDERLRNLSEKPLLIRMVQQGSASSVSLSKALDAALSRPPSQQDREYLIRATNNLDKIDQRRRSLTKELEALLDLGIEFSRYQSEIDKLEEEFGDAAHLLPTIQKIGSLPSTAPNSIEHLPLVGRWFCRRRLTGLAKRLPKIDWKAFGWPLPTADTVETCIAGLEKIARWQKSNEILYSLEEKIRSSRSQTEIVEDIASTSHEIEIKAAKVVSNLLSEALSEISESEHERLSQLCDKLHWAEAQGNSDKISQKVWASEGALLLKHFPLWAITNLSAARCLPFVPALFDLVVIDEASQCDIASALPLLARARRAVIIGDPAQLSHVTRMRPQREIELMRQVGLVQKGRSSEHLGGYLLSLVSLFQLAQLRTSARHLLRDHYRSHPDIADYISQTFYSGRLFVLTESASLRAPPGFRPGLHWTDIKGPIMPARSGCYAPDELNAIVQELKHILIDKKWRGTVGVASPFQEQAKRISDHLIREIPPEIINETELMASTIHQFQGDARDLVLISLCLGPDMPKGSRHFLSQQGRLINVAVSRARAVCHVFGNIEEAQCCGIPHITSLVRACLGEGKKAPDRPSFQSPWEKRLYDALMEAGIEPIPQYAIAGRFLDLAIVSGDYRLDVEVDGEAFHRDIDGKLRHEDLWRDHQLRSIGWDVMRFWVYELREDMNGCVKRIKERLKREGDATC